jgi:hypothetical protein
MTHSVLRRKLGEPWDTPIASMIDSVGDGPSVMSRENALVPHNH